MCDSFDSQASIVGSMSPDKSMRSTMRIGYASSNSYESLKELGGGSPSKRRTMVGSQASIEMMRQGSPGFEEMSTIDQIKCIAERSQQTDLDVRKRSLQTCRL